MSSRGAGVEDVAVELWVQGSAEFVMGVVVSK